MWRSIFALVLALVVSGCANVRPGVPASLAAAPTANGGWVFGSIGVKGATAFTTQGFLYRAKGAGDGALVAFKYDSRPAFASPLPFAKNLFSDKPDFFDAGDLAVVFAYQLPAGEYELYDVHFFINGGQLSTRIRSKEPFSIPFKVSAGAATYLGEFLARSATGRNVIGLPGISHASFAMRNRSARDLAALKRKGIALPEGQVIDASSDIMEAGIPFFGANATPAQP